MTHAATFLTAESGLATSSSDLPSAATPSAGGDEATDDHDGGADQVPDEQLEVVLPVADQPSVQPGPERTETLRDGEEHHDRFRSSL